MDENKENFKLLDKMREIRDNIEREIFERQSVTDSKNDIFVENIEYIGKFEINEKETNLFMVSENVNGMIKRKIVDDNCKTISILTEQGVVFAREELSVDKMNELQKSFLEAKPQKDLSKMEKDEINKISKALGMEEKELDKIANVKLKDEDKYKELDKKEIKGIRELQSVKTSTRITDKQNLSQALELEKYNNKPENKFVRFSAVYSDALSKLDGEKQNDTAYTFVGIREDGTAQRIDLQMDNAFGNTNTEKTIKYDNNNTARKDSSTKSRYKLTKENGNDKSLSIEIGTYGELKMYVGEKAKGSNDIIEKQIETVNIRPSKKQILEKQNGREGIYKNNDIKNEAKENEEELRNGKSVAMGEVDGKEDDILILDNGTETTFEKEAKKINCNPETLKAVYKEIQKSGRNDTVDEILEEAKEETQDIEAQQMGAPTRNKNL